MKIQKNVNLTPFNTFRVPCVAKEFLELNSPTDLNSLNNLKNPLFLGGGSNLLFVQKEIDSVVKNNLKGKKAIGSETFEVASGETWNEFVQWTVEKNLSGVEKMIDIPGTIGGAVAGNIGAYGQTISDVVVSVKLSNNQELANKACQFGYRESIFKKNPVFFITSAVFKLSKSLTPLTAPTSPKSVSSDIISQRRERLPDWTKIGTAGSFFKNPFVSSEKLAELLKEFPDLPNFTSTPAAAGGGLTLFKLSAGFLLEKLGWRGKRIGKVGTWEKHALVVVNYGGATGQEILEFTQKMQADVKKNFEIYLEPEVNIISETL